MATSARPMALSARRVEYFSAAGPFATLPRRRMPAVSIRTISLRPHSSVVSTASRVVPGTSDTIARSSPRRLLRSDDLPTFGRPTKATAAWTSSDSASIAASQRASISPPAAWPPSNRSSSACSARGDGVADVADDVGLEPAGVDLTGPLVGLVLALLAGELGLGLGREGP